MKFLGDIFCYIGIPIIAWMCFDDYQRSQDVTSLAFSVWLSSLWFAGVFNRWDDNVPFLSQAAVISGLFGPILGPMAWELATEPMSNEAYTSLVETSALYGGPLAVLGTITSWFGRAVPGPTVVPVFSIRYWIIKRK